MHEQDLAECFADSVWHCEHHNLDLNSVGKFGLSTIPRQQGFKVVLTGEGADEHFAGYPFFPSDFLREPDLAMPNVLLNRDADLRDALQKTAQSELAEQAVKMGMISHGWEDCEAFSAVNEVRMPASANMWHPTIDSLAEWVQANWIGTDSRMTPVNALSAEARENIRTKWHPLHSSEYIWSKTALTNVLLTCLGDRTEMAHSIEARPPFLDHIVSEYVNQIPPSLKLAYTPTKGKEERDQGPWWENHDAHGNHFSEKWILREVAKPFITQELYERKKHPYTAPLKWRKGGPLHSLFQTMCTREAIEDLGFVDYDVFEKAFDQGFGDDANAGMFRFVLCVASWVTLGKRFGIKKANVKDYAVGNGRIVET